MKKVRNKEQKNEVTEHSITVLTVERNKSFSLIEIILAIAIFMILAVTGITTILHSFSVNKLGEEQTNADLYAQEGLEAVRSMKNQNWSNLTAGVQTRGLRTTSGFWEFNGTQDVKDKYTRQILISAVNRDGGGNIVESGGSVDPDTLKVTSNVSWNFSGPRNDIVSYSTYLTNFRKAITSGKGGMLVYGNGGTTSDAVVYRVIDIAGNWNSAASVADIDSGTTNRHLRSARLFASGTRNEKILVSRHYDGSFQYIYAQVFDGSGWGYVQLLSSWAATNFLDVRNFDGTYLANGNFMVVYRDGTTTIPKYRIWNGTSWGTQQNTTNVGGVPNYIAVRARPETNEVMLVTYDQLSDTNTAYYDGTNWTSAIEHAGAGPTTTKEHVDFIWSPQNPLKGALVYPSVGTDTTVNLKIWTANGSGGGSWSGTVDSGASGGRLGAIDIDGRKGVEEWLSCQKNANSDIYCFGADSTPLWSSPTSNILTPTSDTGIQRSFDVAYEALSGTEGIAVYSNNNATPVYRLYTASSNSFGAQTNLTSSLGGVLETVRTISLPDNDEIMIVMADTNQDLFTIVWDGAGNSVYSSGGKARTAHGISGSTDIDFWFDFAWDRF